MTVDAVLEGKLDGFNRSAFLFDSPKKIPKKNP